MPSPPPDRQAVRARVLTRFGWLTGSFHLPQRGLFAELLEHSSERFFRLTDVEGLGLPRPLPFFALAAHELQVVTPLSTDAAVLHGGLMERDAHHVTCVLPDAVVEGTLRMIHRARFSDLLEHARGFLLLTDCQVRERDVPGKKAEPLPLAFIQVARLVGASEPQSPP